MGLETVVGIAVVVIAGIVVALIWTIVVVTVSTVVGDVSIVAGIGMVFLQFVLSLLHFGLYDDNVIMMIRKGFKVGCFESIKLLEK